MQETKQCLYIHTYFHTGMQSKEYRKKYTRVIITAISRNQNCTSIFFLLILLIYNLCSNTVKPGSDHPLNTDYIVILRCHISHYKLPSLISKIILIACIMVNWTRKWQPTPVFLPAESHGWRSLGGLQFMHAELDMTE